MAIKTSQKLKAEVIEDFSNGDATISADAIADGETKVSMRADERASLFDLSTTVVKVDGDNPGVVILDQIGNEVGFIPMDAVRALILPYVRADISTARIGPLRTVSVDGVGGLAILDDIGNEVGFIPMDTQPLRLPHMRADTGTLKAGPLTARLVEGVEGIVFVDAVGNGVAAAGSASDTVLLDDAAVLKKARPANSVVTLGHSKTEQNSWGGAFNGSNPGGVARKADVGWLAWADYYLRGSINWLFNAGVGGENDAEILARVANDVIAKDPAWCIVMGGTCNSIHGGMTADQIIALQLGTETGDSSGSILGLLQDAGIRTAWLTDPTWYTGHADLTPANLATLNRVNRAMLRAPSYKSGLLAFDANAVIIDPLSAAGSARQYMLQGDDNIHQAPWGARAIGYMMAHRLIAAGFPLMDILIASAADTYGNSSTSRQLLDNPLFTGSGGTNSNPTVISGTIPAGLRLTTGGTWGSGYVTSTTVARPDGYGSDLIITVNNTGADGDTLHVVGPSLAPRLAAGDIVEAAMQVDITGMAKVKGHELACNLSNGSVFPQISTLERDAAVNGGAGWGHEFYDQADIVGGVMKTGKASVPSGALVDPTLRFKLTFGGAGGTAVVRLSCAQFLKNS